MNELGQFDGQLAGTPDTAESARSLFTRSALPLYLLMEWLVHLLGSLLFFVLGS